jgi:GT2 family glycosyltransferase
MDELIRRLRRLKLRLSSGSAPARLLVPVVEVLEFSMSHGMREVAFRTRVRLRSRFGMAAPPEPLAAFESKLTDLNISPSGDRPATSIVIPVLDQPELTRACLASVIERTTPGTYEVIVVDNGSGEPTRQLLASVQGLRVIWNESNAGFVDACNQGAAAARGEYLLFLNNDTVVQPGWLDAMVATFGQHESVGAVGARILYPNGRLQEAGVIVWRDGGISHYGRYDDANAAEFAYVREVDFCSGACLLIPRTLFQEIGGFDAHFSPAYYEDADLAFRLREKGSRVMYQPAAQVVHFEGGTAGTNVSHGFKRHQAINQPKFVARHTRALAEQYPRDFDLIRSARDRHRGRRILIMDARVPHYDEDAGSLRMRELLEILLELNCQVTFVPDDRHAADPYASALRQLGIEVWCGPIPGVKFVAKHRREFDAAILCRAPRAESYITALSAKAGRPYLIVDTVDLHFLREQRLAELEGDAGLARSADRTRESELRTLRSSDMVWVTSTYEAELLRQLPPMPNVEVVPTIHAVRDDVIGFDTRRDIAFVGGFRHAPNEDAVHYFVKEILPLIRASLPGVRLLVAGSHLPPRIERLASDDVLVLGRIPDVKTLLDACRVSIAPLRYGAGIKGKVTESMASGVPVVATPVAAEGMGLVDGEHVLVGSSPGEFARRVIEVYRNPDLWNRLSQNGRQHMRRHFSHESVRSVVRRVLDGTPQKAL